MMIGGERDVVQNLDPIFATLAPGTGSISRTPGRWMLIFFCSRSHFLQLRRKK
jgi:6-phosphogluconate dehydrogenase (decarboxylating)